MITMIDHISLAVKEENFKKAENFFTNVLGAVPCSGAEDPSIKFYWQINSLGSLSRLELIRPTGPGSFLDGFLSSREGGIHHITMETPDIEEARKRLDKFGVPYFGYRVVRETWKELFIHPKDAFGVLIQIAEMDPDEWIADELKFAGPKKWSVETEDKEEITLTMSHPGGGKAAFPLTRTQVKELIKDLEEVL